MLECTGSMAKVAAVERLAVIRISSSTALKILFISFP
jgi:hypothetical protein